jgi:hypothetical protein
MRSLTSVRGRITQSLKNIALLHVLLLVEFAAQAQQPGEICPEVVYLRGLQVTAVPKSRRQM